MPGAGFIAMVFLLVILALVAALQPKFLPKQARLAAVAVIAVIAILATVIPSLSSEKVVPTWAVYLLAGIGFMVVFGLTLIPWLIYLFLGRSSQLREAITACFLVLLEHKELRLSDLKSRAETRVGTGIRFNKRVWATALEILEQQEVLKIEKPDG